MFELWVHLSQGFIRRGDALALAIPSRVAVLTVESVAPGEDPPARIGAARQALLPVRLKPGQPDPMRFEHGVVLSPDVAARNPWSQVFELNLTFFEAAPAYPDPVLDGDRFAALELVFASGRRVPVRVFGVEGGEDYGGRYAWRVRAETEDAHILVRGTRFVCATPDAPTTTPIILAMGVVRRALTERPQSYRESGPPLSPFSFDEWDGEIICDLLFCD